MTAVHTDDLDLLERLGGSRATVHRAMVRTSGRVVVAKHAPWDRPDVVAALGREAGALRRTNHPAVVRLLHTIEDDRGRTLVLAHAPGGSLDDRVARHGPLPAAEVADLGARIADGLGALHRLGIVHRDLHPGNIVVDAELQPLLIDLDHALDEGAEHLPADDEVVGHPDHVDPRLFSGHPPGPATDLHALATTLWTLATGTPPARTSPHQRVELRPDGRVPPPLYDALLACLDTGDASAIATTLRTAALELVAVAPSPPLEPPAAPPPPGPAPPEPAADPPRTDLPPPEPIPDSCVDLLAPPVRAAAPRARPGPLSALTSGAGHPGGTTRRWGTAPRPAPLTTIVPARGRRWLAGIVATAVVVITPAALWLARGAGDSVAGITAPPPCGDVAPSEDHVLADLDGDGCSEALSLADGILTTAIGTYRLGQAGDVLVAGDWDGDGLWTPGLYRPATGEAFLFDTAPGATTVSSRPVLELPSGGSPAVIDEDGDGRHELVVIGGGP